MPLFATGVTFIGTARARQPWLMQPFAANASAG
jgi:hypothetical protein